MRWGNISLQPARNFHPVRGTAASDYIDSEERNVKTLTVAARAANFGEGENARVLFEAVISRAESREFRNADIARRFADSLLRGSGNAEFRCDRERSLGLIKCSRQAATEIKYNSRCRHQMMMIFRSRRIDTEWIKNPESAGNLAGSNGILARVSRYTYIYLSKYETVRRIYGVILYAKPLAT